MPELEGVALERVVAERVMKWKLADYASYEDFTDLPCFHAFRFADCETVMVYREGANAGRGWSPLRSMSDAWEIVTAMAAKGYKHSLLTDSAGCTSRFAKEDSLIGDVYSGFALPGCHGEAICRAALLAVE